MRRLRKVLIRITPKKQVPAANIRAASPFRSWKQACPGFHKRGHVLKNTYTQQAWAPLSEPQAEAGLKEDFLR